VSEFITFFIKMLCHLKRHHW